MVAAEKTFQRPEVQPSVNYFDHRIVGKNVKRWVFFPGDTITPHRKADIDWLAPGGEETTSPCLQKYGRGFIPRGLCSMLELGGEPIPMKHLGDLQASAWAGIALNEEAVKNKFGFIPVYPGDGLAALRAYYMNDQGLRRGIDEVRALVGKEWEECHNGEQAGILDEFELAMFGDGIEPTLRGLTEQVRHARFPYDREVDTELFRNDLLRMCDEFKLWAENKLSLEHANLKIGATKDGWVYSYSPLGELLLAQLEIPRQDQPLAEMAKMHRELMSREPAQVQTPVMPGMTAADMQLVADHIEERLTAAREAMDAQYREKIAALEARLAEKPSKSAKPAESPNQA